jgi:hypothetical protein
LVDFEWKGDYEWIIDSDYVSSDLIVAPVETENEKRMQQIVLLGQRPVRPEQRRAPQQLPPVL